MSNDIVPAPDTGTSTTLEGLRFYYSQVQGSVGEINLHVDDKSFN